MKRISFLFLLRIWFLPVVLCFGAFAGRAADGQVIVPGYHHLGDSTIADWPGVDEKPEATTLKAVFEVGPSPAGDRSLRVRHRDVDGVWWIRVNGTAIGELQRETAEGEYFYPLPADVLQSGPNRIEFVPDNATDDIAIGDVVLISEPLRAHLNLVPLTISVRDEEGRKLPARVSIHGTNDLPAAIHFLTGHAAARRAGLIYLEGNAACELPRGTYRVLVTRGMEWSRGDRLVELTEPGASLDFVLKREVDTTGYIAADTHLHTFTVSGHGDATIDERMITLAGEGVELAVATDHNHNVDYTPNQTKLELNEYFTPVIGNEVTTDNGHFNAFPLNPGDAPPDHKQSDWVKLVEDMRLKGAKVVILNHPRWPDIARSPFTRVGLNRASGDRANGIGFTFDAMELVNATVDTRDPMYLFVDWFGLLNRGEHITAVGVSDSHTVDDPVGLGRTYIMSRSDDPAKLDVDELGANIVAGRSSVSLGIFTDLTVNGTAKPGDLVAVEDGKVSFALRVAAPSWITPRIGRLYVNGVEKASQAVRTEPGKPTDAILNFEMPFTGIDVHVVFVVTGDPVTGPGWKTLNDYTLAATNPVYLDVNGDGVYTNPRAQAEKVLRSTRREFDSLLATLQVIDPVLGVQILSLTEGRYSGEQRELLDSLLEFLATREPLYALYLRHRSMEQKESD